MKANNKTKSRMTKKQWQSKTAAVTSRIITIMCMILRVAVAKAGEHGKGFGVVAQKVRSLTEQSRQATNQVHTFLAIFRKPPPPSWQPKVVSAQ